MFRIGQKIRLKKDLSNSEYWCVTPVIKTMSGERIIMTIDKFCEEDNSVHVEEMSDSTFLDLDWIDTSYREDYFDKDLFKL